MISPFRKKIIIISAILAIILIAVGLTLYFVLSSDDEVQFQGAVVSNGKGCAPIGKSILEQGGTVIDAAIATLFCEGITNPQGMGLGGGFLATIYIKSEGKVQSLIARETAPMAATEDMFVNKTVTGGLASGVPGEIRGYAELHRKYGRLNWADLIEPTIKLCLEGHEISRFVATKLKELEAAILEIPSMRELYINPATGEVYNEGDMIKRPKLAETLQVIAKEGEDVIYNGGSIGKMLVEDIQAHGGIITEDDLKNYRVRWVTPASTKINGYSVHTTSLPATGPVLHLILNLIQNHLVDNVGLLWHRIIEAFKHAYGLRTQLGDMEFVTGIDELVANMSSRDFANELYSKIKDDRTFTNYAYYGAEFSSVEDHGTANIAVLGRNGDAIIVTSTINNIFGAKRISQQTGIILNDEMDDFSTPGKNNEYGLPPSPANFIRPNKMPLSSMVPTIVLDSNKNPRLLIGAAGGTKITTSVAQIIICHLLLGEPLEDTIVTPRLHHQLSPMEVQYEPGYDQKIIGALSERGHVVRLLSGVAGFSAVTAISVHGSKSEAVFDPRRPGSTAYY